MKRIYVSEGKAVYEYLLTRGLLIQYKKAKAYLAIGNFNAVNFKKREPKDAGLWYFRINQQFRGVGIFVSAENFVVLDIYNHQNS